MAPKLGCVPSAWLDWVRQAAVDPSARTGVSTETAQRIKDLEREVEALRPANKPLKLASARFAATPWDGPGQNILTR